MELLDSTIDSFEKLEIARALRDGAPRELDDLRAALELPKEEFVVAVEALVHAGIVTSRDGVIALGARAGESRFRELMTAYDDDRFAIAAELSKIAMRRVRTMAARAFSTAFVFKKPKRGDDG
nr:hypothetical protein [Kofleriaceae bacterium]